VRYRVAGRLRKLTLGPYPRLGLADARKLARKALAAVDGGADPAGEKRASRRAARVGADKHSDEIAAVVAAFLAGHAKRKLKLSSQKEAARILGKLVAGWKGRRLSEIGKRDIRELLDEIIAEGHGVMANRTLSWLRILCGWAIERELISVNPCAGIRPPHDEAPRERVVADDELAGLWKAAEALGGAAGRISIRPMRRCATRLSSRSFRLCGTGRGERSSSWSRSAKAFACGRPPLASSHSLPVAFPGAAHGKSQNISDQAVGKRAVAFEVMVLEPGGVRGIAAEMLGGHAVMLAADHPTQAREIALSHVGVNAVTTVGVRMIDALGFESRRQKIPVRDFISGDD
jgi:hypothetical protein